MNRLQEIETRLSAIKAEIEADGADLDALEAEVRGLKEERQEIAEKAEKRKSLLDGIANMPNVEIIKDFKEERKMEEKQVERIEDIEIRSFANYIKRQSGLPVEYRSGEQNFDMTNNGAVIPTTIANMVISTVKEMCPIFARATIFNVKGTLKVPVYGLANTTHDIAVAYQSEFTDITADAGQFTSVDLSGFLAGALTLVGKSVINNSQIDVVSFVVREMSTKIALFLEKELLNGTTSYATGALSTSTTMKAGSTSAISADNLIDLQAKIPTAYQANACWTMAPATFAAIRKLKDGNGQYLIQNDFSQAFPYAILGKPVYLSDNMPAIGSAAKAVLYGDYSGLAVNLRENISIQVLNEKYATMHAVGLVSWFEFDSDVIDNQKLATLVMSV